MPFDWIRISIAGVLHALATDFEDFLSAKTTNQGASYAADHHRFFHDMLDDPREIEKYQRRFARFRKLRDSGSPRPLIFIRTLDTTLELLRVRELHEALRMYFDDSVVLVLTLDYQAQDLQVTFEDSPNIILHTVDRRHAVPCEYDIDRAPFMIAYHEPIVQAVWRAQHDGWQPRSAMNLPSLAALFESNAGVVTHVSLGEDLERYNYGIPQMPPDATLSLALKTESPPVIQHCVKEMVRTRWEWELRTEAISSRTSKAADFLRMVDEELVRAR